jgi:hypothetical protein
VTLPTFQGQVAELGVLCPGLLSAPEGQKTLYVLPQLKLLDGCKPAIVDALLYPYQHGSYPFRLFFADEIVTPAKLNWNVKGERILERIWFAFSWIQQGELRLAQMVTTLLRVMV